MRAMRHNVVVLPALTSLDILTLSVAIIGAVTGVVALAMQAVQFGRSGPRVRIQMGAAVSWETKDGCIAVEVQNVGRLPTTLLDVGFAFRITDDERHSGTRLESGPLLPGGRWHGPPLPCRIDSADALRWEVDPRVVTRMVDDEPVAAVSAYVKMAGDRVVISTDRMSSRFLRSLVAGPPYEDGEFVRIISLAPSGEWFRSNRPPETRS